MKKSTYIEHITHRVCSLRYLHTRSLLDLRRFFPHCDYLGQRPQFLSFLQAPQKIQACNRLSISSAHHQKSAETEFQGCVWYGMYHTYPGTFHLRTRALLFCTFGTTLIPVPKHTGTFGTTLVPVPKVPVCLVRLLYPYQIHGYLWYDRHTRTKYTGTFGTTLVPVPKVPACLVQLSYPYQIHGYLWYDPHTRTKTHGYVRYYPRTRTKGTNVPIPDLHVVSTRHRVVTRVFTRDLCIYPRVGDVILRARGILRAFFVRPTEGVPGYGTYPTLQSTRVRNSATRWWASHECRRRR